MNAVVFIPLTQGQVSVIDFADFEKVRPYKWHARRKQRRYYAVTTECGRGLPMHHLLLGGSGLVDHKDGDGLNNRRENLRPATCSQNLRGFQRKRKGCTSQFRGVSWNRAKKKWKAKIERPNESHYLGMFVSEIDAAKAYDLAAVKYFGEFASLNLKP